MSTIIALTQVYKGLSVSPEVFDKCDDIYANWSNYEVLESDIEAVKRELISTLGATNISDKEFTIALDKFNNILGTLYQGLIDEIEE